MMQDKTSIGISDTFREYIEALVEEVVINGEPFDAQKKWLRKNSEAEGVSYKTIESNLNDLFEAIKELEEHESKSGERLIGLLAKECYLSETMANKLIDKAVAVRTQKEVEKKAQEEREQKSREEAERKAREERVRIAKEKAQLQKKLDAERNAREESERKAREEAERKAREEAERKAKEELEKKRTTGKLNGHEYVDLGLPSGTLWATCNVGATQPEEYGDYFAWGETTPKSIYDQNNYTYGDSPEALPSNHDSATSNWGSGWRIPSKVQWDELLSNTTKKWTMQKGVQGWLFTSKNGQTLFLPAAGGRWAKELRLAVTNGYYRSRSSYTGCPADAWCFFFGTADGHLCNQRRYSGFSVRPVRQN